MAYNATLNQYLVVWRGDDDTAPLVDNEGEIFGQRLDGFGAEIGTNDFRISDAGPNGNSNFIAQDPAVAFNSTNNEYLVVWRADDDTAPLVDNELEIFGQRLTAVGAAVGANDFRISDMGPDGVDTFDAFEPEIAYNSTNNEYLVVWRGDDDTAPLVNGENEIFGQRLTNGGAAVGANDFRISDMGPDADLSFAALEPALAYDVTGNEYLVVWSGADDTGALVAGEFEIFGQRLNAATGAALGTNDFRISDMGGTDGDASFIASTPAVAYNATNSEYLVVWSGDDNTAPLVNDEFEIFGQRLNATGAAIGTNDFRLSDMGPNGDISYGALDPALAYNPTNGEYLTVWEGDDNTSPLDEDEFEIFGQRFSPGTPTGVVVYSLTTRQRSDGVELRWRSSTEAGLLGFNVYRGGAKLNRTLIPVVGRTHRYLDRTARPGHWYLYRLEAIGVDGRRRSAGAVRVGTTR